MGISSEKEQIVTAGLNNNLIAEINADNGNWLATLKNGEVYVAVKRYITYNANGATSGNVPTDENSYISGQEILVLGNTSNLTKTGYIFDGWKSGTTFYKENDTIIVADEDIILTANWKLEQPTISQIQNSSFVYDGTTKKLIADVTHTLTQDITITYQWYKVIESENGENINVAIVGATSSELSIKNVNDSGTYILLVEVSDGEKTSQSYSNEITVSITPKEVDVLWSGNVGFTWEYNNTLIAPTANAESGISGETLNLVVSGQQKNASNEDYTATAIIENANYTLKNPTQTFNITKANYDMSGISFSNSTLEYNGQDQTLSISGSLPVGLDGISPTVSYVGFAKNVLDGEINVDAFFSTESTNYNIPLKMSATINILPVQITVTADAKTIIVGEKNVELTYTLNKSLYSNDSLSGNLERENVNLPGKYDILQGTLSINQNYTIIFISKKYIILNKEFVSDSSINSSIIFNNGFDPDAKFVIELNNESELKNQLTIPQGFEINNIYSTSLTLLGNNVVENDDFSLKIKVSNDDKAKEYSVFYMENGILTEKKATSENGYIIIEMKTFGDVAILSKTEVQIAKDEAIQAIIDTYNDHLENEYSAENETLLANAKTDAINSINNATSLTEVENAKNIGLEEMAEIKTEVQIAKDEAIQAIIDTYNDHLKNEYSEENKTLLENAKTDAINNINNATSLAEVENAKTNGLEEMAEIETENYLNLWWIIILLSVVIVAEIFAIIFIKNNKNKENNNKDTKKQQKANSFAGLLLTIIIPFNAYLIISILALVVLGLAAYIAYLLLKANRKKKDDNLQEIINAEDDETSSISNFESEEKQELQDEDDDEEEDDEEDFQIEDLQSSKENNPSLSLIVGDSGKNYTLYKKSFMAKLIQSPEDTQARYTELKNYILGYKDIVCKHNWNEESYYINSTILAKVKVGGKNISLFLPLNPETQDEKYHLENVSEVTKYKNLPSKKTIKGSQGLSQSKTLIDKVMKEKNIVFEKVQEQKYSYKFQNNEQLVKKGLIKVSTSKKTLQKVIKHNN